MKLHMRLRQVVAACTAAAVLLSTAASFSSPVLYAATVAQEVMEAEEVAGTLTGGEFDKIWLKLTPTTRNESMTIVTEWDRLFPDANGVGFYVLDQDGLSSVLNGDVSVSEANLSAGSKLAPNSPDNELGAVIQATGGEYTVVLFNDSTTDASFELRVKNGVIQDDSDQVRDLQAVPTAVAGEEAPAAETTEAVATPVPAATTATTATTTVATPAPVATTAPAAPAPAASVVSTATLPPGVTVDGDTVSAEELRGFLGVQNEQHYFDVVPNERDANVTLLLAYQPQDSSELARRLNFWVLDEAAFTRYTSSSSAVLSEIAVAAGSSSPELEDNQRQANFTVSGMGPYVVIVYNNSTVPGDYTLSAQNATLVDDSQQSVTAQLVLSGAAPSTGTDAAATDAGTATTDTSAPATTTAADAAAGSGRTGEPGGTYVVQSGDSLSLIPRDIFGDLSLWDELCAYNNLADCNNIEVGQTLKLPTRAEIGAGIAPAATPVATTAPAGAAAAAAAAATPTATVAPSEEVTSTTTATTTTAPTTTAPVTTTQTTTATSATRGGSVNWSRRSRPRAALILWSRR